MADCMSRGRIMSGFARGVPREYNVYNVPMACNVATADMLISSPMLSEAWTGRPDITPRAWEGPAPVA